MNRSTAVSLAFASLVLAGPSIAGGAIPAPEDVAVPPADAIITESGLASRILVEGTGEAHPGPADVIKAHYTGWTSDGTMFDSSLTRGTPIKVPLNRVIPGWVEGVQLMVVGEKRRFWIPENLAYKGQKGKPAGMLVFDVELLDFIVTPPPPPPPAVPDDVAAPPTDAEFTKSGLASKVLEAGTGEAHPTRKSTVTVHYTGWTTDGKMFDSSVVRGETISFGLTRVIQGWTEGLQLMVVGEKRRFWIPEKLAYKGQPGMPAGMLVFDVELFSFE
jgi:peptidylprolyl isomerase